MKIRLIFIMSFFSLIMGYSQELNYSALILSLDGEGVINRDGEQAALRIPLRFYPGDKIQVRSGNATVMLFSGEEVKLSAVSEYMVPSDNQNSSSLQKMANQKTAEQNLLAESGMAYQIRGKSGVFPTNTKMADTKKAFILLPYKNFDSLEVELVVRDAFSQKILDKINPVQNSFVSLAEMEFIKGKDYYWILKDAPQGRPEMGTIIYSEDNEVKPFSELNLVTNFDYLEAISKYYSDKYYYQTYWLLKEAIRKFPEINLYQEMLDNLLRDK